MMILNTMYGKLQRLNRLRDKAGIFTFLALDHQLSVGRIREIDSSQEWVTFANAVDITGIVLNKGAFRDLVPTNRRGLILQTIGAPSRGGSISRIVTATVEDAIRLDATCISIQLNFTEPDYLRQLECCVGQIEGANRYNFPVLCMLNFSRSLDYSTSTFTKSVRQCAELGVDLIKLPLPADIDASDEDLKRFISLAPPLLLAGGDLDDGFQRDLNNSRSLGFKGVCVGRNIFKALNPHAVVERVRKVYAAE